MFMIKLVKIMAKLGNKNLIKLSIMSQKDISWKQKSEKKHLEFKWIKCNFALFNTINCLLQLHWWCNSLLGAIELLILDISWIRLLFFIEKNAKFFFLVSHAKILQVDKYLDFILPFNMTRSWQDCSCFSMFLIKIYQVCVH